MCPRAQRAWPRCLARSSRGRARVTIRESRFASLSYLLPLLGRVFLRLSPVCHPDGSLQWLPARVMCVLPRWHTQRCGRCQNSRYFYGQRRGLPPRRQLRVRPEHDRAQSCAIGLRSPASERPSHVISYHRDRYSPDIHRTPELPSPPRHALLQRGWPGCPRLSPRGILVPETPLKLSSLFS